jgi:hypothetical protein
MFFRKNLIFFYQKYQLQKKTLFFLDPDSKVIEHERFILELKLLINVSLLMLNGTEFETKLSLFSQRFK